MIKALGAAALALFATAGTAHAFCGFYVSGSGGNQEMFNDATQVVLMRDGTRTVLSMQNNYQGPPSTTSRWSSPCRSCCTKATSRR